VLSGQERVVRDADPTEVAEEPRGQRRKGSSDDDER